MFQGPFCVHSLGPIPTSVYIFLSIVIHARLFFLTLLLFLPTIVSVWVESLALRHSGEHCVKHPSVVWHEPDLCHPYYRQCLGGEPGTPTWWRTLCQASLGRLART